MRKTVQVLMLGLPGLVVILMARFANASAPEPSVYESRGFVAKSCYRHVGKILCDSSQEPCYLQAFGGASRLTFQTNLQDLKGLFADRPLGDFTFRVLTLQPVAKIEILDWRDADYKNENPNGDLGWAHDVKCPTRSK